MDAIFHVIGVTAPLLFSPGANNMLLMNAGVVHGFKQCMPHVFGSVSGFIVMLFLCYLGLSELIDAQPMLLVVIKWGGALWLLYLAWGFYRVDQFSHFNGEKNHKIKPFGFFQAFAFMLTNPGAISLSLIVFSVAVDISVMVLLTVALVGVLATLMWTINGRLLRSIFSQPRFAMLATKLMCVALFYSAIKILR